MTLPYVLLLALGCADPKQKNNDGAAAMSSSNRSMYALMNVVQALNNNKSFIPYRQSKVTRILQDSLCKASGAVLITCLVSYLTSSYRMILFYYERQAPIKINDVLNSVKSICQLSPEMQILAICKHSLKLA